MKVVDASVLVTFLSGAEAAGARFRRALVDQPLAAPHLIDLEVAATLRKHHLRGLIGAAKAQRALERLALLPLDRHPHRHLLRRCWELRDNVKTYDAAFVALAEALGVPLLTADTRLANAPGIRCDVEVLT